MTLGRPVPLGAGSDIAPVDKEKGDIKGQKKCTEKEG